MSLKLGKKPASYDPHELKAVDYKSGTITLPSHFGHGNTFSDWGMLGNDQYGDCVWAGAAHEHMDWENLGGNSVSFTDQGVLSDYSAVTGFNPNDPNSDQGTDVHDALKYRTSTGIIDGSGNRHKIAGWVALEPGNITQVLEAIYVFDAVGIGFEFPASAMDQFNNGQVWSVVGGSQIEGGHYVPLVGRPQPGQIACITWGKRQVMTEAFLKKYCDEAYALLSLEALKNGKTYEGFNLQQLQADLKAAI